MTGWQAGSLGYSEGESDFAFRQLGFEHIAYNRARAACFNNEELLATWRNVDKTGKIRSSALSTLKIRVGLHAKSDNGGRFVITQPRN